MKSFDQDIAGASGGEQPVNQLGRQRHERGAFGTMPQAITKRCAGVAPMLT